MILDYAVPDQHFWDQYARLWQDSHHRSPFQSPGYLNMLAQRHRSSLAVFQWLRDGKMEGAAFFRKDQNAYRFLSEIKADHSVFVLHRCCDGAAMQDFFRCFFERIKKDKWRLILSNHPDWAVYSEAMHSAGRASGLIRKIIPAAVCPVLEEATPEALLKRLSSSRELRYRLNRLRNQQGAEFEALQDDVELDDWVDDFCKLHIQRWENTTSPSKLRKPERQALLEDCLRAWIRDGALVRFAVKAAGRRIAFVIGLQQESTLVHHATAYDAAYRKFSPGKALLLFIGQWMESQRLNRLDFGEGNEAYKYDFANQEHVLEKIFIAAPSNISFRLRAGAEDMARSYLMKNPGLRRFYRERVKPLVQWAVGSGQ